MCDGDNNCGDGSDETQELCGKYDTTKSKIFQVNGKSLYFLELFCSGLYCLELVCSSLYSIELVCSSLYCSDLV